MQIKLYMGDKQKTFSVPFIKARMLRRSIELGERFEDFDDETQASLEDIDAMVEFVVDLFNHQFSVDELWDGLTKDEFIPELTRCMNEVNDLRTKPDPNVRKGSKPRAPRR